MLLKKLSKSLLACLDWHCPDKRWLLSCWRIRVAFGQSPASTGPIIDRRDPNWLSDPTTRPDQNTEPSFDSRLEDYWLLNFIFFHLSVIILSNIFNTLLSITSMWCGTWITMCYHRITPRYIYNKCKYKVEKYSENKIVFLPSQTQIRKLSQRVELYKSLTAVWVYVNSTTIVVYIYLAHGQCVCVCECVQFWWSGLRKLLFSKLKT